MTPGLDKQKVTQKEIRLEHCHSQLRILVGLSYKRLLKRYINNMRLLHLQLFQLTCRCTNYKQFIDSNHSRVEYEAFISPEDLSWPRHCCAASKLN
ncbi:hypothetical protein Peur_044712 [Populus x canadensis]